MKRAIMCVLPVGAAGGALLSLAGLVTPVIGMSLGCVYGLVFCLVVGHRASTPGGGLLWGLAFALLFWLFGPATIGPLFMSTLPGSTIILDTVRARFPDLVGYILFFGAPLGICLGTVNRFPTLQRVRADKFDLSRAAVVGGLAGIVGGWGFCQWVGEGEYFSFICGGLNMSC